MENKSALTKFSIALAVLCAVICVVAIAPLGAAVIFALVTLICLLGCLLILFFGAFAWLFTVGEVNIFSYATMLADFGLGLFNFMTPIANFSFHYLTPIAGAIALAVGVVGIIISAVGISKAKGQSAPLVADGAPSATDLAPDTSNGKKVKKRKSNRGACIASLVVCCVFSAVSVVAIIVAAVAVTMF